jgi:hypothetical protein
VLPLHQLPVELIIVYAGGGTYTPIPEVEIADHLLLDWSAVVDNP